MKKERRDRVGVGMNEDKRWERKRRQEPRAPVCNVTGLCTHRSIARRRSDLESRGQHVGARQVEGDGACAQRRGHDASAAPFLASLEMCAHARACGLRTRRVCVGMGRVKVDLGGGGQRERGSDVVGVT